MKSKHLAIAGGAIALLGLATAATAAEPLRLTPRELDAVTAGAATGAEIFARSAVGGTFGFGLAGVFNKFPYAYGQADSGSGDSVLVFSQAAVGPGPAMLSVISDATTPNGSASSSIEGEVRTRTTPNSSVSVGFFTGETQSTGQGTANIGARARAEGDFAIPFAVTLPIIPGSGRTFSVTIGVAANNPLASGGNPN